MGAGAPATSITQEGEPTGQHKDVRFLWGEADFADGGGASLKTIPL